MSKLFISEHPLIQNKVAMLRDKETGSKGFREMVSEVAMLLCYEATGDLLLSDVRVETPIASADCKMIETKLAVVPVLRAGIGMAEGLLALMPTAKVGHIGLYRDPDTLEPVKYYCKLPSDIGERTVFLTDPMLATGGTATAAIDFLKEKGAKKITLLCILATPVGVKRVQSKHSDVDIYTAAYDPELDEHGHIAPGLGDAGDRIFGTK